MSDVNFKVDDSAALFSGSRCAFLNPRTDFVKCVCLESSNKLIRIESVNFKPLYRNKHVLLKGL